MKEEYLMALVKLLSAYEKGQTNILTNLNVRHRRAVLKPNWNDQCFIIREESNLANPFSAKTQLLASVFKFIINAMQRK